MVRYMYKITSKDVGVDAYDSALRARDSRPRCARHAPFLSRRYFYVAFAMRIEDPGPGLLKGGGWRGEAPPRGL